MSRTMVKVQVSKRYHEYIDFQTISLEYGRSPHFLLSWRDFEALDNGETVIADSLQRGDDTIPCKAYVYRRAWSGELYILFLWKDKRRVKYSEDGYVDNECGSEEIVLPYNDLFAFIRETGTCGAPSEWKCLARKKPGQSRLVFVGHRNLRKCVSNPLIRKKLARFLRDRFYDPAVPQINFYDRVAPYSFIFEDVCDTAYRSAGAVTLLNADDPEKARFLLTSWNERNPGNKNTFSRDWRN